MADDGHFLHLRCSGDFVLTTSVTSHFAHRYDQAGLMLRVHSTETIAVALEVVREE